MRQIFGGFAMCVLATSVSGQDQTKASQRGLNPESIEAIQVRLGDNATEACWTNLKEVREYAEEKLRIKGYNIAAELPPPVMPPNFLFWIGVGGERDHNGLCNGSITISVQAFAVVDEFLGRFMLLDEGTSISNASNNLNRRVIEATQAAIDQM